MYGCVGGALLAVAVDEGAGRWAITTEVETMFCSSAIFARTELWRIAAAIATPAPAA